MMICLSGASSQDMQDMDLEMFAPYISMDDDFQLTVLSSLPEEVVQAEPGPGPGPGAGPGPGPGPGAGAEAPAAPAAPGSRKRYRPLNIYFKERKNKIQKSFIQLMMIKKL